MLIVTSITLDHHDCSDLASAIEALAERLDGGGLVPRGAVALFAICDRAHWTLSRQTVEVGDQFLDLTDDDLCGLRDAEDALRDVDLSGPELAPLRDLFHVASRARRSLRPLAGRTVESGPSLTVTARARGT